MSNMTTLPHEEARPEMDDLLHDYFQAEMPQPWPSFKTPKPARARQPVSVFSRYAGRVALAACVALLVAGYFTLGQSFPGPQTNNGLQDVIPPVGLKDGSKKADRPKADKKRAGDPVLDRLEPMGNDFPPRPR